MAQFEFEDEDSSNNRILTRRPEERTSPLCMWHYSVA